MPDYSYPLSAPLDYETLVDRLETVAPELNAIREYVRPNRRKNCHVLVKNNIGVEGFATTAGSRAFEKLYTGDATCVRKLREAGIDLFGVTNMTELAGFVTHNTQKNSYSQMGGFPRNPHGEFFPRGSSSGSAIAVAAGLCDAALGTETRGSLMAPGLANGVFAYKPTRGLISRHGVVPLSHHLDTVGVIARSVELIRKLTGIMRGRDEADPATAEGESIRLDEHNLDGVVRLGLISSPEAKVDEEALAIVRQVFELQEGAFELVELSFSAPEIEYKMITSLDIKSDMDAFLSAFAREGTPKSFNELYAWYTLNPDSHPYGMERLTDAASMAKLSKPDYDQLIESSIASAYLATENVLQGVNAVMSLVYLDSWAIAGSPTITIPIGKKANGEPIGVMLACRHGEDGTLLEVARRIEAMLGH